MFSEIKKKRKIRILLAVGVAYFLISLRLFQKLKIVQKKAAG